MHQPQNDPLENPVTEFSENFTNDIGLSMLLGNQDYIDTMERLERYMREGKFNKSVKVI